MQEIRIKMKKKQKNKGSILAIIALLILLLSLSSMALIGLAREARVRTAKNVSAMSARLAADAGVERVLYLMNERLAAGTWILDDVPTYTAESLTACNANYTVTFEGDLDSGYQITSVGTCGLATRTVCVTIELTSPFAEDFAVLTDGGLMMRNIAVVKGYNSTDPTDTDVLASIGTQSTANGSINIDMEAQVFGDAYVGPGGDPDQVVITHKEDSITGEVFVLPTEVDLPTITPPVFTASKGAISGNNLVLTISESGEYTDIIVEAQGKLRIEGDVVLYATGNVRLENQAVLEIPVGSTLKLYFDGNFSALNSCELINESHIPYAMQLYGTDSGYQFIEMVNSSDIYAVVYAPNAEMWIYNDVALYGSFIIDSFDMRNGGSLNYDKALKEVTLDDELIYFKVTHWEEL